MLIIRQKVKPDRISYSKLLIKRYNHENFWNQAKRYMRKFNGIPQEHFHLFLKECEWRFNNSNPKVHQSN